MDIETDEEVKDILDKLTTSGETILDRTLLKQLKQVCQTIGTGNVAFYEQLGRLIFKQLSANHAQIRYGTILVIDYLFPRPHLFRQFLCDNLDKFFELTLEINDYIQFNFNLDSQRMANNETMKKRKKQSKTKILKPKVWAEKLRTKTLECYRKWYQSFGPGYELLEVGYRFLVKKEFFKDIRIPQTNVISDENESNASGNRQQTNSQREEEKKKIAQQYIECNRNLQDLSTEIHNLITQIDNCIEILIPKFDIDDSDQHVDDFTYLPMRGLFLNCILTSKVCITRDHSNSDIIDNLEDLCKELNRSHKVRLEKVEKQFEKLLQVVTKKKKIEEILDQINELKIRILTIVSKFNDINVVERLDDNDSDMDVDDFEDVPDREDILMQRLYKEKQSQVDNSESINEGASSSTNGPTPCRAKLPSGRLCPRRDLVRCPFHGELIPRDDDGLPIDVKLREIEIESRKQKIANEWRDPKYLKELSLKTGKELELKSKKGGKRKYPKLIDIKKLKNTPRNRLMKRLCSKQNREKVEASSSKRNEQMHLKYSDQWNYALQR